MSDSKIKNFTDNNKNLLYGNENNLSRYKWDKLVSENGPTVVPFCSATNLGQRADINNFKIMSNSEIENIGCVSVPGNPFYSPTPESTWTQDKAEASMQWLLGPGETANINGKKVKSFMDDNVKGICSGTSSFVDKNDCTVGVIDGTGNIDPTTGWDVLACKSKSNKKGINYDRKNNISKAYGKNVIKNWKNIGKGEVKPLLFGGDEVNKKDGELLFVKNNKGYIPEEIIAVHKTWGQVQPNIENIEQIEQIEQAPNGKVGNYGEGGGWFNGGILSENITISKKPIKVVRKVANIRGDKITTQHVIELSARGDFYDSSKYNTNVDRPIEGIYKNFKKTACGTTCAPYLKRDPKVNSNATGKIRGYDKNKNPTWLDVGARTGACIVTRDLYGPGYYEASIWLPKTLNDSGRGYVFAMWMFQYTEAYSGDGETETFPYGFLPSCKDCKSPGKSKPVPCWSEGDNSASAWCPLIGGTCAPWSSKPGESESEVYAKLRPAQCDPTIMGQKCCDTKVVESLTGDCAFCTTESGVVKGDSPLDGDVVTTWGHEIDIEIPSNTGVGQKASGGNKNGWDTFNCNPWWGDMEEWETNYTAVPYTSEVTQSKEGTDFTSTDGNWHTIGFEWVTPNMSDGPGILTWFYDGIPIHRTTRFVPNRVGRLVLGPWPASWGAPDGIWMPFENVTVLLADLTILPYTDEIHAGGASAWPQSQDQAGLILSDGEPIIGCDFKDFSEIDRAATQNDKRLGPNTPTGYLTPTNYLFIIIKIIGILAIIGIIALIVYLYKRKKE